MRNAMMRLHMHTVAITLGLLSISTFLAAPTLAADAGIGAAGGREFVSLAIANPRGVAVDTNGNLYVADVDSAKVYKINAKNDISPVAGAASITAPLALSVAAD